MPQEYPPAPTRPRRTTLALLCLFGLIFAAPAWAATFQSIASGNWNAPATWAGGVAPGSSIAAADTVIINHSVVYNLAADLENSGRIRIETTNSAPAAPGMVTVPSGRSIKNFATGRIEMNYGKIQQCRFVGCGDSGTIQSGVLTNIGGTMTVANSYVEIAQDWVNESGGQRLLENSCVKTGQNFSQSGAASLDRLTNTSISVGWHASGSVQYADGTLAADRVRYQLAGTSGSLQLNSGTASGDIDYITLKNHVTGATGGGQIFASSSLSVPGGLNLDAYWTAAASSYQPNGRFSGTQTRTDITSSYFPDSRCTFSNNLPLQALLSISKSNGVGSVTAGASTTYAIVVTNAGPSAASGSVLRDPAVAGLTCSSVSCSVTSGAAACPASPTVSALQGAGGIEIATFPASSSLTFSVTCTVTATGQ